MHLIYYKPKHFKIIITHGYTLSFIANAFSRYTNGGKAAQQQSSKLEQLQANPVTATGSENRNGNMTQLQATDGTSNSTSNKTEIKYQPESLIRTRITIHFPNSIFLTNRD